MQYVSFKQGDPTIKADPQTIKPKTWTNLKFGANGTVITPRSSGLAHWGAYINVKDKGDAKKIMVRFMRDPDGAKDSTGINTFDLTSGSIFSHMWMFLAKKKQPVSLQVYHDGSKNLVIATREFKSAIL